MTWARRFIQIRVMVTDKNSLLNPTLVRFFQVSSQLGLDRGPVLPWLGLYCSVLAEILLSQSPV